MPPKARKQTLKPWTNTHENKFNWLYNWFIKNHDDKATKDEFINENKRRLMSLIEKEGWSNGSKLFQLLFMVLLIIHQKLENLSQIMDLKLLKK